MNMHVSAIALARHISDQSDRDPVFDAIAAHRRALAARISALYAEEFDPPGTPGHSAVSGRMDETLAAETATWNRLLATTATSTDGLLAYAEHLRSVATELDEVTEPNAPFKQAFMALHASALALGLQQA